MGEEQTTIPSQRFQFSYVPWMVSNLVLDVVRATEEMVMDLTDRIAAHHNWLVDQHQFAEAARREIEAIAEVEE